MATVESKGTNKNDQAVYRVYYDAQSTRMAPGTERKRLIMLISRSGK